MKYTVMFWPTDASFIGFIVDAPDVQTAADTASKQYKKACPNVPYLQKVTRPTKPRDCTQGTVTE